METYYFKLVLGSDIELITELSTGAKRFVKGVVYSTTNYKDIVRLCGGGNPQFVRCYDANGRETPIEKEPEFEISNKESADDITVKKVVGKPPVVISDEPEVSSDEKTDNGGN